MRCVPAQGRRRWRGLTRLEVLVVVLCVLLLLIVAAMIFNSVGRRGGGARSSRDATQIRTIHQSWLTFAREFGGEFPTPSLIIRMSQEGIETPGRGPENVALNTTANLFSACVMQNYIGPNMCVSPVESNPVVKPLVGDEYDYDAYQPTKATYWDPIFVADLQTGSNVSYAHMPIHGRLRIDHWRESLGDSKWPLVGNRGPLNGVNDPKSFTFRFYKPDDQWDGQIGFADGHVEFLRGLPTSPSQTGRTISTEGLFRYDGEQDGDGIFTFTRSMTIEGPVIQHD